MLAGLMFMIHMVVSVALILIILLQTTKGSGMGAAFGGSSQTLFGSTGRATFLTKVTIGAAVVFIITSVGLSFVWTERSGVVDESTNVTGPGALPPMMPPGSGGPGSGSNVPGGGDVTPPADNTPSDGLPDLSPDAPVTPAPEAPLTPGPDSTPRDAPPSPGGAPAPGPDDSAPGSDGPAPGSDGPAPGPGSPTGP